MHIYLSAVFCQPVATRSFKSLEDPKLCSEAGHPGAEPEVEQGAAGMTQGCPADHLPPCRSLEPSPGEEKLCSPVGAGAKGRGQAPTAASAPRRQQGRRTGTGGMTG